MVLLRSSYLALVLVLLGATPAAGSIVEGVEFTDIVSIDVPGGTNLQLSTSEDVYVFAPNDLFLDMGEISVGMGIFSSISITANTLELCDDLAICPLGEFDLTSDVLLTILDPIGNLHLEAGGSVVLSATTLPEPATLALIGLGVLSLGAWRDH